MFLPHDHPFKRNKDAFIKNRVEKSRHSPRLNGEGLWVIVNSILNIVDYLTLYDTHLNGYDVNHN